MADPDRGVGPAARLRRPPAPRPVRALASHPHASRRSTRTGPGWSTWSATASASGRSARSASTCSSPRPRPDLRLPPRLDPAAAAGGDRVAWHAGRQRAAHTTPPGAASSPRTYDRMLADTEEAGLRRSPRASCSRGPAGARSSSAPAPGSTSTTTPRRSSELVLTEPFEPMARRLRERAAEAGRATATWSRLPPTRCRSTTPRSTPSSAPSCSAPSTTSAATLAEVARVLRPAAGCCSSSTSAPRTRGWPAGRTGSSGRGASSATAATATATRSRRSRPPPLELEDVERGRAAEGRRRSSGRWRSARRRSPPDESPRWAARLQAAAGTARKRAARNQPSSEESGAPFHPADQADQRRRQDDQEQPRPDRAR